MIYHEYPPVMCQQIEAKLRKLSIDKVMELVAMARQDAEHALDCLDEWMEQYDNDEDDEDEEYPFPDLP